MIDCHLHLQKGIGINEINTVFERYQIKKGIISNLVFEGKTRSNVKELLRINEEAVNLCKQTNHLYALFFCDPAVYSFTNEIVVYILNNSDVIKGLKIHPSASQINILDSKFTSYYEFASKYQLPILFHCDDDTYCHPKYFLELSKQYPNLKIIMGHMGINTDHEAAIHVINQSETIYGDISWVTYENVLKIMNHCPSNRILFGTDAPFDGELGFGTPLDATRANFKWFNKHFTDLKNDLTQESYHNLTNKNAIHVFNL